MVSESELIRILATITTRTESGKHFTEAYPDEVISALLDRGWIYIFKPVHDQTGIEYGQQYWTLEITNLGQDVVDETLGE